MCRMCSRVSRSVCVLFALVAMLVTRPAYATVWLPSDLASTAARADQIVHGRVSEVRVVMPGGRHTIESLVTMAVAETVKGSPSRQVVFRVPAGQVGRYRRVVVGAPELTAGDELIVFLRGVGPMLPSLVGLGRGVYRVRDGLTAASAIEPGRPVAAFLHEVRSAMVSPR